MRTINQNAFKKTIPFAIFFFLVAFLSNIQENFFEGISNGLLGMLLFGGITFLFTKSILKNKVRFLNWQWIFYVLGVMFGVFSPLFWLIMFIAHTIKDLGEPFFNLKFHKRTYIYGIVITIILIITLLFIMIFDYFNT